MVFALTFALGDPGSLLAREILVSPGDGALAGAIAGAAPGDTLRLSAGRYDGGIVVDKPLTLQGEDGTVIDNHGQGRVLSVAASGVVLRRLTVRGSGVDHAEIHAGIYLGAAARETLVEECRVEDNLFGIAVQGASGVILRRNRIANRNDLWLNNRGNGINVWNSHGSRFEENRITGGRDGIFITLSSRNLIRGNHFDHLRFAVHYMNADRNEVRDNVSRGNTIGFALMYSNRLTATGNLSVGDRDHGILFHTVHHSELADNAVLHGAGKCTFVYTSAGNLIHGNWFEGCGIGLHFTGGSERNLVYGNAFVRNHNQVKYTGTVFYEWSRDRRGNFWSDNPAFDMNGDGLADLAFKPNDLVDRVVWRYPLAQLLLASPALQTLRIAQGRFPALYPGGVIDSWPLMVPPPPPPLLIGEREGGA
ncbi:MAG: nitrous oxide reductase family maturation protein NosD [Magnetococcales bacterium]|nr:nitrous oxide reductase family maturation protein NosD [Magnetococcales bacterium]